MEFEFSKGIASGISREEIEKLLQPGKGVRFFLSFDQALEKLFCHYSLTNYQKINFYYPLVGVLGLLAFLIADYQIAPDAIYEMFYARLLGCASICFSVLVFVKNPHLNDVRKTHRNTQLVMCTCALIVHGSLLFIGSVAARHGNFHYQTGSLLIIVLLCTLVSVHFRYVLPTILLILVSQLYFSKFVINARAPVFLDHVFIFSAVAAFACLANARMEHEVRKNFLQSLLLELKKEKLEQAKAALLQLSISDPLTGILNRRGFEQSMSKIWLSAIRHKYSVSLLMLDIDFFKQYNDSHGHPKGDLALKVIAEVFQQQLKRPDDMVARWGGEEFAIVLPQTDKQAGLLIAESIRKSIWEKYIVHPESQFEKRITVSIGLVTTIPKPNSSYETLIQQADTLLYQAKNGGRNRVQQ